MAERRASVNRSRCGRRTSLQGGAFNQSWDTLPWRQYTRSGQRNTILIRALRKASIDPSGSLLAQWPADSPLRLVGKLICRARRRCLENRRLKKNSSGDGGVLMNPDLHRIRVQFLQQTHPRLGGRSRPHALTLRPAIHIARPLRVFSHRCAKVERATQAALSYLAALGRRERNNFRAIHCNPWGTSIVAARSWNLFRCPDRLAFPSRRLLGPARATRSQQSPCCSGLLRSDCKGGNPTSGAEPAAGSDPLQSGPLERWRHCRRRGSGPSV